MVDYVHCFILLVLKIALLGLLQKDFVKKEYKSFLITLQKGTRRLGKRINYTRNTLIMSWGYIIYITLTNLFRFIILFHSNGSL